MKLVHLDMENTIELDCRKTTEWIIESPVLSKICTSSKFTGKR